MGRCNILVRESTDIWNILDLFINRGNINMLKKLGYDMKKKNAQSRRPNFCECITFTEVICN